MNHTKDCNVTLGFGKGEICNCHGVQEPQNEVEPVPESTPEPITTSHTFVVDVKEFRAALELAVCEKKTPIPVLTTVCLSPRGSSLRVLSTDLDKWTITDIPAMIDDGAGNFLIPHKAVLALLKGETGIARITSKITNHSDKFTCAWVKLDVGGCMYDIPSMNPANFPVSPVIPAVGFDVSGSDLKASLGRIIPCISTEESRYTINGALFECDKNKLVLVATDGHRLGLDSIPLHEVRTGKALIQRDSLAWVAKNSSGDVVITLGEEHSFFHIAQTVFITRNLKGQFPNWQAVTPRKDSFTLTASFPSGDELAKTLAKVARMADERSGCVKFRINGHCVLSASSVDAGSASATVKASIKHSEDDSEIAMGFNSHYILEMLKAAGKNSVVLSLKDQQSAGVFTIPSLPEYQYVLMPMRI